MINLSLTKLIEYGVLLVIIISSVVLFSLVSLENDNVVSSDSVNYRQKAFAVCDDPLSPMANLLKEGSVVGINWATIVSLGAIACNISETYADTLIFLINLLALTLLFFLLKRILEELEIPLSGIRLVFIVFLFQFWLLASLVSLNKEIISYLFVAISLMYYLRRNVIALLAIGLLCGLFKVQFLVFSLMLIISLKGVRFKRQLLYLSILLPMLLLWVDIPFLNAEQFYSRYDYNIRTEKIARFLSDYVNYPFGYLFVMPVRLFISVMSGFSPMRIASIDTWQALAYQVTAVITSLSFLVLFWKILAKKLAVNNPIIDFIFIYCLLMCLLPFFQLRYFLPLLPVLLVALVLPRNHFIHASFYDPRSMKHSFNKVGRLFNG